MKIELKRISVKKVTEKYLNDEEEGVVGFGGKLDIRPKYQREFIYGSEKRNAVIGTLRNDFPLNVMYWVKNENGTFEVMDGQQRTISICEYVEGNFSINERFFHNLEKDEKEQILNYELMIYFCEGTDKEKLDWFKIINIAGMQLSNQELRNVVYTGEWLTDAKRHFSKTGCPAYEIGKEYMKGSPIRQEFLETTLKWINKGKIEEYMAKNQQEPNANELWLYFQAVINWVKTIFPTYRREMKGLTWGLMHNDFKNKKLNSKKLEEEIAKLMQDDEVGKKAGIYPYVLTRDEKFLNLRVFTDKQKRESYEKQKGICPFCKEHFEINEMEADHKKPWHKGGKTTDDNCQMLCVQDNRTKSGK